MGVPKAVQKQLKQAEQKQESMRQAAQQPQQNPPPADTAPPPAAPPTPPEQTVQQPPGLPTGEQPPADPTPAAPATPPASQPAEDFGQAYRVLQGKYNAEVPELHRKLQAATAEIAKLQKQIQEMAKAPPKQADASIEKLKEEFPEELVAVIERQQATINTLNKQIADLSGNVERVSQTSQATAEETFFDHLDKHAKEWREINTNKAFIAWLQTTKAPFSNLYMDSVLTTARKNLDATTAAEVFNTWKAQQTQQVPHDPQRDQSNFVVPNASRANGAEQPQPPIYTTTWIQGFRVAQTKGRTGYSPEQIAWIENDIARAATEGRIRQG